METLASFLARYQTQITVAAVLFVVASITPPIWLFWGSVVILATTYVALVASTTTGAIGKTNAEDIFRSLLAAWVIWIFIALKYLPSQIWPGVMLGGLFLLGIYDFLPQGKQSPAES